MDLREGGRGEAVGARTEPRPISDRWHYSEDQAIDWKQKSIIGDGLFYESMRVMELLMKLILST